MALLRSRSPGIVGPPIAVSYRGIISTNNPGSATNAVALLTTSIILTAKAADRTLVVIGRVTGGSVVGGVSFCGQPLLVHFTPAGADSTRWYIATANIPRNISGPLVVYTPGGFNGTTQYIYTVTGLINPNPLSTAHSSSATATAQSIDLDTKPGGIIIAAAFNNITAAQSCAWTGDQTPTENAENSSGGIFSTAHTLDTNEDTANTITATYAVISTTICGLIGASFR